jgi:hypothetical protein
MTIIEMLVPVERIELPTFGLQNRCSTAELNRRNEGDYWPAKILDRFRRVSGRSNTRLARKGPEPIAAPVRRYAWKRRPLGPPFPPGYADALLAEVPEAVLAAEPGAGLTDEAVALRVALIVPAAIAGGVVSIGTAEGSRGYGCGRTDRRARHAGGDIAGPEAAVAIGPAAVIPAIVAVLIGGTALVTAGVRISRAVVLAIGVRVELRAIAGVGNHLLRHYGACQRG